MLGSSHIRSALIGVVYRKGHQTLDVCLLVTIFIGKIQYNFVLGGTSPGKISQYFSSKDVNIDSLVEAMNEFRRQAKNWTETLNHTGQFFFQTLFCHNI